MQAYLETTQWLDGSKANHTYLLDGDQMWAYIPVSRTVPQYFAKPIRISRSGRRFTQLAASPFGPVQVALDTAVRTVQGSNGRVYSVDVTAGTCTCPGYTYRGACKHVKELE